MTAPSVSAAMLRLDRLQAGRYSAPTVTGPGTPGRVFGGQLLAQLVVAACSELAERPLTSLHTVLCRAVRADAPLLIDVETVHEGRSAASLRLSLHQEGPVCAEATALSLLAQDLPPGHGDADVPGSPEDASPVAMGLVEVESRLAGGGDLGEPAGDPEMLVWVRAGEAAAGTVAAKAMLAYASEPWFVAAALRRHEGWSQDQAFTRFVPAVVSHSLWFHEHEDLAGWWAFQASSPHLRHGRVFGRADVRSAAGRLLASVSQENLLRPLT